MPWSRVRQPERRDTGTAPAQPDRRDRDRDHEDRYDDRRRDDRGRGPDRPRDDRSRDSRDHRDDRGRDDRGRDDRGRDDRGRDDRARDDRGRDRDGRDREARERYERERERERIEREAYERQRQSRDRDSRGERDSRGDRDPRDERAERERAERERYERERYERERYARERERYDRGTDRAERDRYERERAERERYEYERAEYERAERERADRERLVERGLDEADRERHRHDRERSERDRITRDPNARTGQDDRPWTETGSEPPRRPEPIERVARTLEAQWRQDVTRRDDLPYQETQRLPEPAAPQAWTEPGRTPPPDAYRPPDTVRPAPEPYVAPEPDPYIASAPYPPPPSYLPPEPPRPEPVRAEAWIAEIVPEPTEVVPPPVPAPVSAPPLPEPVAQPIALDAEVEAAARAVLRAEESIAEIGDPEQALAAARIGYDPVTLHEQPENVFDLYRIRDALATRIDAADDNPGRARLLGLRSVVQRMLGELGPAQSDAKMALVHAEATGQLRRISVAQSRLANVLVRQGDLDEADRLFTLANSPELPDRLRATIHHFAGRCAFEQDRYIEACQHFEKALELRKDADPELISATEVALDALFSRVAERGWGPYPRSRDDILLSHKPPAPAFNEQYDRWGYQDENGNWPIGPQFADVQPFRDGVAWVRPVGIETWGLIDEAGRLLVDPRGGYLGVGSFSDGLAWVSRDGQAGWFAIDKANRVVIQAQFEDVRPFRRGIAIVRQRGKWGAVESNGRLAVQFAFDAFATGLADGRYVEGFTDEGLAIVEVGGRKGVIDRSGRVMVPLAYPTVVIHPVAFLFTDPNHRWGAIGRNGQPLIAPVHPSRKSVTDELESLLADTRPIL
jgi:tetratricopeptide (TPR) repeat protein